MRFAVRSSLALALCLVLVACSVPPAPSISQVEAPTIVPTELASALAGEPTRLVVRGSGFGDVRGLSRLFYGGIEVNDAVIATWSDDAIELAFHGPSEILGGTALSPKASGLLAAASRPGERFVPPDQQRFEVRTLGGSVTSDVVRLVAPELENGYVGTPGDSTGIRVRAHDAFGVAWPDGNFTISTNRGTLDPTAVTTDAEGFASTTLTTDAAGAAHALRLLHEGRVVAHAMVYNLEFSIDPSRLYVEPGVEGTHRLTVLDRTSGPVADTAFRWLLVHEYGPRFGRQDLGTHATDATGVVELAIPPLEAGVEHVLYLVADGYVVARRWVEPGTAPID
jgi:hypothetical protein